MSTPTHKLTGLLFILATTLTAGAPAATPTPEPTPVTVKLKWFHNAQFAGFYVAQKRGWR